MTTNRHLIIKSQILDWMITHCMGHKNAVPRAKICEALTLDDRVLREICEELKSEGHIATNSQSGYWAIPLVCNDPEEIEAVRHSIADKRSRAYKLLDEANRMAERLSAKVNRQPEFQI